MYSSGHGDVDIAYEDGSLELLLHAEQGAIVNGVEITADDGEELDPSDTWILVTDRSRKPRPSASVFDQLGVGPGQPFFLLSENALVAAADQAPLFGFSTAETSADDFDAIRVQWTSVTGPGTVSLWQTVGIAGVPGTPSRPDLPGTGGFPFTSFDGVDPTQDYFIMPPGGHADYNWAFSTTGDYAITFQAIGVLRGSGETLIAEGTYNFRVVPEPASMTLLGIGLVGAAALVRGRRVSS